MIYAFEDGIIEFDIFQLRCGLVPAPCFITLYSLWEDEKSKNSQVVKNVKSINEFSPDALFYCHFHKIMVVKLLLTMMC